MYITAHCFSKKVKIDQSPIVFKLKDVEIKVATSPIKEDEGLILEIKQKVEPKELIFDKSKIDPNGKHIDERLSPYRTKLHEVAQIVEGLLSVNYIGTVPPFETHKVMVSVYPENNEEQKMINEEKVSRGFGDIITPAKYPFYQIKDGMFANIELARKNLPALFFLTQAIRSQDRKDEEVAFFLYFKIIEGYFGDGTPNLENALLKNKAEIEKYLKPNDKLKEVLQKVLGILKLPSKANQNYEGIISDLVLLRHKLAHFNEENSERYFQPDLKFQLDALNKYLRLANMLIIKEKIK